MVKRKVVTMVMLGVTVVLSVILAAGAYAGNVMIGPDVKVEAQGKANTLDDGYKARILATIRSQSVVALGYLAVRSGSAPDGGDIDYSGSLGATGAIVTGNSTSHGGRGGAMSNSGALTGAFRTNLSFGIRTLPTNLGKPIDHRERLPLGAQASVHYHLAFSTRRVLPP